MPYEAVRQGRGAQYRHQRQYALNAKNFAVMENSKAGNARAQSEKMPGEAISRCAAARKRTYVAWNQMLLLGSEHSDGAFNLRDKLAIRGSLRRARKERLAGRIHGGYSGVRIHAENLVAQ